MSPPHLGLEAARYRFRIELVPLLGDHDLKGEVQQQVTEFVLQLDWVLASERLIELERFLDEVRT
jgi:hypothetical protein